MKRKVGELFNKPIVQGNENVLSSNEILVEQKGDTFSLKERVNGEIKEVSGSGSSNEGLGSNIEYLDVSGVDVPYEMPTLLGGLVKFTQTKFNSEELAYKGIADAFTMIKHGGYDGILKITALAIPTGILDLPIKVTYLPTGEVTDEGVTKDVLDAGLGGLITQVLNSPRITKEQFYNLNA
jgi:hypothetical protein